MRYLSVCSGIEAVTCAWHSLGFTPVAFAEIDKFASAVLAHHFTHVRNMGDFTKITEADVGPIDLLVGGTPCQSFSVAGRRLGLDDPRGNLALEFCRLARRLRPMWLVWENVPGVHSSWSGAPEVQDIDPSAVGELDGHEDSDFGAFLDALEECGYSACWRILDTQHVRVDTHPRAVPQRRERLFVVGYLGDWRPPAAVLLEPEGLCWNSPPRRQARQEVAGSLGAGSKRSGDHEVVGTLCGGGTPNGHGTAGINQQAVQSGHIIPVAKTLDAARGRSGVRDHTKETFVATLNDIAGASHALNVPETRAGRLEPHSETFVGVADLRNGELDDVSMALQSGGMGEERGRCINALPHVVAFDTRQITNPDNRSRPDLGDPCHPLHTHGSHAPAIAVSDPICANEARTYTCEGENNFRLRNVVPAANWAVRRLTPLECERLQGLPDGWTDIVYRGKRAADGPRYRALGNAMSVNVMRWLGQRLALCEAVLRRDAA